jgi:hypothetical protein
MSGGIAKITKRRTRVTRQTSVRWFCFPEGKQTKTASLSRYVLLASIFLVQSPVELEPRISPSVDIIILETSYNTWITPCFGVLVLHLLHIYGQWTFFPTPLEKNQNRYGCI